MRILLIDNRGAGTNQWLTIADGSTLQDAIDEGKFPVGDSEAVRVNGEKLDGGMTLRDGDRVSITPAKITVGRS